MTDKNETGRKRFRLITVQAAVGQGKARAGRRRNEHPFFSGGLVHGPQEIGLNRIKFSRQDDMLRPVQDGERKETEPVLVRTRGEHRRLGEQERAKMRLREARKEEGKG